MHRREEGTPGDEPQPAGRGSDQLEAFGAVMFVLSGLCTCLTLLHSLSPRISDAVGIWGSVLTLGGLCFLVFGATDERPLRHAPAAEVFLLVSACAAVAQRLTVMPRPVIPALGQVFVASAPFIGLLGGACVSAATIHLLVRGRRQPRAPHIRASLGLGLLGVGAITANAFWVWNGGIGNSQWPTLAYAGIALTALGEFLIASALRRGQLLIPSAR